MVQVSYESGFVLSSSAQQREVVAEVTDDPMLQQIQIITGYIAQARQQNRCPSCRSLRMGISALSTSFCLSVTLVKCCPDFNFHLHLE